MISASFLMGVLCEVVVVCRNDHAVCTPSSQWPVSPPFNLSRNISDGGGGMRRTRPPWAEEASSTREYQTRATALHPCKCAHYYSNVGLLVAISALDLPCSLPVPICWCQGRPLQCIVGVAMGSRDRYFNGMMPCPTVNINNTTCLGGMANASLLTILSRRRSPSDGPPDRSRICGSSTRFLVCRQLALVFLLAVLYVRRDRAQRALSVLAYTCPTCMHAIAPASSGRVPRELVGLARACFFFSSRSPLCLLTIAVT